MSTLFAISFFICLVAIEFLATTSQEIKPIQNSWDKANHFIAFLPNRDFSLLDIFADFVGIVLGIFLVSIVYRFFPLLRGNFCVSKKLR